MRCSLWTLAVPGSAGLLACQAEGANLPAAVRQPPRLAGKDACAPRGGQFSLLTAPKNLQKEFFCRFRRVFSHIPNETRNNADTGATNLGCCLVLRAGSGAGISLAGAGTAQAAFFNVAGPRWQEDLC
jgi:hypothetical protein